MISDLRTALEVAEADGPTVQLIRQVLSALPPEAHMEGRGGLDGLLSEPVMARIIREDMDLASGASDIAAALDRGDLLSSVAIGPRVALSLYDAHLEWALGIGELEREQARDASLKLHGIGLLAQRLFEGSTPERAGEMLSYEAGRALLIWFICVEVALAASTEDEPVTVQHLRDLLDQHGEAVIQDLNHLASRADREGGQAVIRAMLGVISSVVQTAASVVPGLAGAVRRALPKLTDNSQEALAGETERLGMYTLLTARLVAEIEAERLEEALPEPPAQKADPELELVQARIEAAQGRWDSGPLDTASAAISELEAKLVEHTERQKGLKKALRTVKQKLSRTVDRRARIAEAPPAGEAEAEAAVERGQAALKEADKSVRKAVRQVGAIEEGVVAAKAAVKRSTKTLKKREAEAAEAQAVVEALQTRIVALRADDEAQLVQIRKADKAAAQEMAQALVDKSERLEEARARLEAIAVEGPGERTRLEQIDLQLQANRGAFSDLSGNRDALADALVLSREAKPAQCTVRDDKAAVLAQAEVKRDRLSDLLLEASKVFQAAESARAKVERAAGKARDRRAQSELKLGETISSLASAQALAARLADREKQIGHALAANEAAQAAAEAAAVASRKESFAAVERALGFAREHASELDQRAEAMDGALRAIAERQAAHGAASKALASQRKGLKKALKNAQAQRKARLSLMAKHREQIGEYGQSLSSLSGGVGPLVRASRKAGAAHTGAAARVVGARDAHVLSTRRVAEAQAGRDRFADGVGQADALVQQARAAVAAVVGQISAAHAAAEAKLAPPRLEVEAILAELKPTMLGEAGEALRPATTWTGEASTSDPDEGATAMFSPQDLKARLQQEQQGEEVADATVMFTRDKLAPAPPVVQGAVVEQEEEDEEAATMMFSVEQLRARAEAELEEEPDDDATVIFQRPPPKDEDS